MTAKLTPLASLKPAPWNPRKIDKDRFENLCRSIEADDDFLRLRPILAMRDGTIYAGNMRYRACEKLSYQEVWAVVENVPEKLAKERALRDNAAWGENVDESLGTLLAELKDAGSDIDLLGFDSPELERLLKSVTQVPEEDLTEADLEQPSEPITKPGDLWLLGEHRLLCGDAEDVLSVERLLADKRPNMIYTDPPYGMRLDTDYTHMPESAIKSKRYDVVIGDDRDFDPQPIISLFSAVAEQFWWGADYYYDKLPPGGSWIVWDKRSEASAGVIGNHFEVCWSKSKHRREVKRHHWVGFTAHDKGEARSHPTQKPVALVAEMIGAIGEHGDIVLDLFGGSGSTLIAAEQTGCTAYLMEIDPGYCDVIVNRWQKLTGKTAVLESVN